MKDLRRVCVIVAWLGVGGFMGSAVFASNGLLTPRGFSTVAPYATTIGLVGIGAFCAWILLVMAQRAGGDRPLHRDDTTATGTGLWTTDDDI